MQRKSRKNVLFLGGPYMFQFYRHITMLARARNWCLQLDERYNPPRNWSGDGVLSMHLDVPAMNSFMDDVLARGIPVVDLLDVTGRTDIGRVATDERALGKAAAVHFHDRGFSHAAFFAMEWTHLHQRRYEAFATAFRGTSLEKWSWASEGGGTEGGDACAEWATAKIVDAPKPVAVLTFNAYNAFFLSTVCKNAGIDIPQEVAILAGWDNEIYNQHQDLPISGIAHDDKSICKKATDLLQRMMDGKCTRPTAVRVPPLGIAVRRSTDATAVADPTLRKALALVSSNIAKPFGPSQIAESLGISLARLNAISQKELGGPMLGEIVRQRINEAKRLMKETDEKLSTIARLAGFCNASYFCKTFRAATGLTPHAWRRGRPSLYHSPSFALNSSRVPLDHSPTRSVKSST